MGFDVGFMIYFLYIFRDTLKALKLRSYQQLSSRIQLYILLLFCRQAEIRHDDGHTLTQL